MYYSLAIQDYVGNSRVVTPNIDYILQNDGEGTYIEEWNVNGITEPSMELINSIIEDNIGLYQLKDAKTLKLEENQTNYDSRRNGIKVVNNVPINIDPTSCGNIAGQVVLILANRMIQSNPPLTITWFDDVNIGHEYTEDEFILLGQTCAYTIFLIQQKLSYNKLAIENATTIEELNAIDIDYSQF